MHTFSQNFHKIVQNVLNFRKCTQNLQEFTQNFPKFTQFGGVRGGEDLINATQTLPNYLTDKYNLKQLNDTYYSLGFQQKLSLISENIDLAKLILKNNFQKLGKP